MNHQQIADKLAAKHLILAIVYMGSNSINEINQV